MGYAAIAGHTDIIEILSQFAPSHYTIWANFVKILSSLFTVKMVSGLLVTMLASKNFLKKYKEFMCHQYSRKYKFYF